MRITRLRSLKYVVVDSLVKGARVSEVYIMEILGLEEQGYPGGRG
jgi:hypothetical protein